MQISGDCRTELASLLDEYRGKVRLIIADPPYQIKSWEGFGSKHDKTYDIEPPLYDEWIPLCQELLADDGSIFIFETPFNMFFLQNAMMRAGLYMQPPLCWFVSFRKSHPRKGWYNNHWEPIMWGTKTSKWYFDSKPLRGGGSRYGGDVYEAAAVMRAKVPGQKPLKLIERLIAVHSQEGDTILDPFGGYGTVELASLFLKRKPITIEVNPANELLTKERIRSYVDDGIYK